MLSKKEKVMDTLIVFLPALFFFVPVLIYVVTAIVNAISRKEPPKETKNTDGKPTIVYTQKIPSAFEAFKKKK